MLYKSGSDLRCLVGVDAEDSYRAIYVAHRDRPARRSKTRDVPAGSTYSLICILP